MVSSFTSGRAMPEGHATRLVPHPPQRSSYPPVRSGSETPVPAVPVSYAARGRRAGVEKAMRIVTVFAVLAGLGLAACGDTTGERAASGGLIGGAAGLALGAPVAGPPSAQAPAQ